MKSLFVDDMGDARLWLVCLPFLVTWLALIAATPDANSDGTFSIGDIQVHAKSAYSLPGIRCVMLLKGTSAGRFLEVDSWTIDGLAIGSISVLVWLLLGAVCGVALARAINKNNAHSDN